MLRSHVAFRFLMVFVALALASSAFAPEALAQCGFVFDPVTINVAERREITLIPSANEPAKSYDMRLSRESAPLPSGFSFVAPNTLIANGESIPGSTTVALDIQDSNGCLQSAVPLTINVIGASKCEKPIVLEPNGKELEIARAGQRYRSDAFNVLGSSAPLPYSWSASGLPAGVTLLLGKDGAVAVLDGTPSQLGKFNPTVTVSDQNGCTASATNLLVVDCPTLFPNAVDGAVARNAYSATLAPTGGTGPYTTTFVSITPSMPASVTNNVLSFTPAIAGTVTVVVSARDNLGCTNNITYTIPVACPVITFNPISNSAGTAGSPFSGTVSANNGSGTYTYAVSPTTPLPPGLVLNATTGVISGTPTTAGSFTFDIEATDSSPNACKGKGTFTINIGTGCPTLTASLTPSNATLKQAYVGTVAGNGGTGPYLIDMGALPAGLTFDGKNTISGTPELTGTFSIKLGLKDAKGCSNTTTVSLTVSEVKCPTLSILPASVPAQTVGKAFGIEFTVSDATTSVINLMRGSLPEGVTFTRNTLGGTPAQAGSFSFELQGSDQNGCPTPVQRFTLTVNPEACPTILVGPLSLPGGTVNTAYPDTPFETKGSLAFPFLFSVSAGALPPGLILKENVLVGTPTTPGTFNFTIKATDAKGCSGTTGYSVTIASAQVCPTDRAALLEPTDRTQFSGKEPITFAWDAVRSAVGYEVMLSNDNGATFSIAAAIEQTSFPRVALSPAAGSWVWFVKSYFETRSCTPSESARRTFSVVTPTSCPTTPARLVAPLNGSTSLENVVLFEWGAVEKAYKYELQISFDGGRSFRGIGTTDATSYKAELPDGTIDWRVLSAFESCPASVSSSFRLNVGKPACPLNPASPKAIAPANGARDLPSPITFTWTDVAGESGYQVVGAINGEAVTFGSTGPNVTSLSASSVGRGEVVWYVQALFGDCPFTVSDKLVFTSIGGSCNTPATTLLGPANGTTTTNTTVALEWSEVKGATAYELFLSGDNVNFKPQGQTSELYAKKVFLPGTQVFWFVRTYFVGCDPQTSATRSFRVVQAEVTCAGGTIRPNAPRSVTVSSPVTFRFSSLPDVKFYRVWVTAPRQAPQLVGVAEPTSAAEVSLTAPVGSTGLLSWQAEAVFSDCPSVLSESVPFTVQAALTCGSNTAPAQTSPGNTSTTGSSVTLSWNPVPNATGYKVWLALPGQPFADTLVSGTTLTLNDLKPGEHKWYLQAIFAGCDPVPSLQTFAFTVQQTEPRCPTAAPSPVAPLSATAQSPVTFVWTSVEGAISYRLSYTADGVQQPVVETTGTSITRPIDPGKVAWTVEAVFEQCTSTRFARSASFEVLKATVCSTDKPQPLAPKNIETQQTEVDFSWSAVGGAISYQVIILGEDGSPTAYESPDPLARNQTRLSVRLDPGTYEWWVVAAISGCDKAVSDRAKFTITRPPACDAKPPVLLAPANGTRNPTTGVRFAWSKVPGATGYELKISVDGVDVPLSATTETKAIVPLPAGIATWKVKATFSNCQPVESAEGSIVVAEPAAQCLTPAKPRAEVVGQALSNTQYTVRWSAVGASTLYELQESETPDFANANTTVVDGLSATFIHPVSGNSKAYSYRVRALSPCNNERSSYSDVVRVLVIPPNTVEIQTKGTAEVGVEGGLIQTLFLPGQGAPVPFTATSDQPWLTINPSSGTLPVTGLNLTLTSDAGALSVGATTATVTIVYGTAGKGLGSDATTSKSLPLSVTLVTPVSPGGKNTPPPDALIIPAVAHAAGANGSQFESDVRIFNSSSKPITYLLNFTPSGVDGTQTGSNTTLQVAAGATTALDDIVASFFGTGSANTTGMIEIRPLAIGTTAAASTGTVQQLATIASSRTFNKTTNGTFGQYVPAVQFSNFIGRALTAGTENPILSMQQIANSAEYRTNFALIEGAGEPAEVMMRVYNLRGDLLAEIPQTLAPSEMKRLDGLLAVNGISLQDGRVEVEVTSPTGKVQTYASRLDNRTNDPLLVSPVEKAKVNNTRYVVPGVAYIDGVAKWRTDLRVFNAAKTPVRAKVTYYPAGNPDASQSVDIDIASGEIKALDNVLNTTFGITAPVASGSIVVETQAASGIIASARTYAQAENGTYGLFAPAVTPQEAVGARERSLYLLQLENSNNFRTNIGLVETTGQDAVVEISMTSPDSKVAQKIPAFTLRGNTFIQFPMANFGLSKSVYNARVSVKVTGGNGRVSAYGALVDNVTQDPTYVPAQ